MSEAFAYAIALALWAVLAWDFGRQWIGEQAKRRVTDAKLENLTKTIELQQDVVNKLAIDWRQKFGQLEQTFKNEVQRIDRAPGAQPLTGRGFMR